MNEKFWIHCRGNFILLNAQSCHITWLLFHPSISSIYAKKIHTYVVLLKQQQYLAKFFENARKTVQLIAVKQCLLQYHIHTLKEHTLQISGIYAGRSLTFFRSWWRATYKCFTYKAKTLPLNWSQVNFPKEDVS